MSEILLVIHLLVTVALIGVVLLQKSEGGGLGIGSGGSGGGFMTGRGTANLLTRTTSILAAIFMALSLTLAILNQGARQPRSLLDAPGSAVPGTTAPSLPLSPALPAAPSGPAVPLN